MDLLKKLKLFVVRFFLGSRATCERKDFSKYCSLLLARKNACLIFSSICPSFLMSGCIVLRSHSPCPLCLCLSFLMSFHCPFIEIFDCVVACFLFILLSICWFVLMFKINLSLCPLEFLSILVFCLSVHLSVCTLIYCFLSLRAKLKMF